MHDLVTFATDYGFADGFVAACHGVVHAVAAGVRIIDVSHAIEPGDVRAGAVVMEDVLPALPTGVHVGVVDPGVGSARSAIAIAARRGDVLVGPDNGLLTWAAEALGGAEGVVSLSEARWHRVPVSATFHGRDVFAPVAAHLASGVPLAELGPSIDPSSLVRLPNPVVRREGRGYEVEVRAVDRFGNVQLAARPADIASLGERIAIGFRVAQRATTFGDVLASGLGVIEDSVGRAALVTNGGSAAVLLDVHPGDLLHLAPG